MSIAKTIERNKMAPLSKGALARLRVAIIELHADAHLSAKKRGDFITAIRHLIKLAEKEAN